MSFFISDAMAEGAAAAGGSAGSSMMGLLPLVLIFVLFYFMLIRPQSKRAKEHKGMVAALGKGDEIVTQGGILGKVTEVGDGFLSVKIADDVIVKVQRQAVSTLLPKGTVKSS
ncbi:MAG: preprotein translocase subunit YajC [Gammaproteobacteria bacterium]|nr:preprotein translocase subunit YajC [Gammaproteobacteria bacterium]MCF6364390.1 preprotein translocase subunit YajC [Gammaproteobacteria bacterium]